MRLWFGICVALLLLLPQAAVAARLALLLEYMGDAGPADAMVAGLERAHKDFGVSYDVLAITHPSERENAFLKAAASYDIVIAGSPAFHELLMNSAGNFRTTLFGSVDGNVRAPNIATVTFADAQAAYLCGFAAASVAAHKAVAQAPPIIGFIGSHDSPAQRALLAAYREGALAAHKESRILSSFLQTFDDTNKAQRTADLQYSQGAYVIMHAAGAAGKGVLAAAHTRQRLVIGQGHAQAKHPAVLLAHIKATDTSVYAMARAVHNGSLKGAVVTEMTLANGGVGITALAPFGDAQVLALLQQKLNALAQDIVRGTISIAPPKGSGCTVCDE